MRILHLIVLVGTNYNLRKNNALKRLKITIMKTILSAKYVCGLNNRFTFQVGIGSYNIGLIISKNQVRLMLIFWHVCFNKNK